jgi:hypothetical protein
MELDKHYIGKLVELTIYFDEDGIENHKSTDNYDYDSQARLIEHCSYSVLNGKLSSDKKLNYKYDGDIEMIEFFDPSRDVIYSKWIKEFFLKNCYGENKRLEKKREIQSIPEPSFPKIEPIFAVNPALLDMPKKNYNQPMVLTELCEYHYDDNGKLVELLVKDKNEMYPNNDDNEYTYNKHLYELDSNGRVTKKRSYFSRTGYDNMTKREHRIMEYDDKGNMVKRSIYDNKDELKSVIEKDYEYNDDGLIVKQFDCTSAGILDKTIVYIYDDKKRIINEIHTSDKGSGFKFIYSYK